MITMIFSASDSRPNFWEVLVKINSWLANTHFVAVVVVVIFAFNKRLNLNV